MTRIICRTSANGYSVVSTGHAGTATSCTAVSAIIGALAGWVHNHAGTYSLGKGEATVDFPRQKGADAVMSMTAIGLLQVQKAAPGDIQVEIITEEE